MTRPYAIRYLRAANVWCVEDRHHNRLHVFRTWKAAIGYVNDLIAFRGWVSLLTAHHIPTPRIKDVIS